MQVALHVLNLLLMLVISSTVSASSLPEDRVVIKYEKGDCLYETIACLYDDSCGPLLRLVYAFCYETEDYSLERPDGSRLACDASCAILLSVFFNTTSGLRLRDCNYSRHMVWATLVIRKQQKCAQLVSETDVLLRRFLDGEARSECWLAGLLCARDFFCRSTLTAVLNQPCYENTCDSECANRLASFATTFGDIFSTILTCLCGQELVDTCIQPASGYISNRSLALDKISFSSPLDSLIEQLGRLAIREQMRDSIWLLKLFEHPVYFGYLKLLIGETTKKCIPEQRKAIPAINQALCSIASAYETPSATQATTAELIASSSTASDGKTPVKQEVTTEYKFREMTLTQWQQSVTDNPVKNAKQDDNDPPVDDAKVLTASMRCLLIGSLLLTAFLVQSGC